MLRAIVLLWALLAASLAAGDAASLTQPLAPATRERIDATVRSYVTRGYFPGAAIGIARNGVVLYVQGYGVRDLQKKLPVTSRTVFGMGSITKHVTDAMILWLGEHPAAMMRNLRPLSLDDRLSKYVPAYKHASEMTLRQLIYNSAGIAGAKHSDLEERVLPKFGTQAVPPERILSRLNAVPLIGKPGSTYDYANLGYWLLGRVIATSTGTSYERAVDRTFLARLDMKSSAFLWSVPDSLPTAVGYAHTARNAPYQTCPELADWAAAPGGIATTVGDLLKWDYALRSGAAIGSGFKRMLEPLTLTSGGYVGGAPSGKSSTYIGMGLFVTPTGYGAQGGMVGYQSETLSFTDGYDVVILANAQNNLGDVKTTLTFQLHNLVNPAHSLPVPPIGAAPPPEPFPPGFCTPVR